MEQKPLSKNVILTGLTSFFTDVSSEMIYPLLQGFLRLILSSAQAILGPVLGIIEGIAEATASLLKVYAGWISDRLGKRKLPAIAGYGTSALAKLALLLSGLGWVFVLIYRFFDRVGKGLRGAPRDALIAESIAPAERGRAFGLQRAMDFAGATLGALIAFFLVRTFMDPVSKELVSVDSFMIIFIISIIPAFLGVIFLFFTAETKRAPEGDGTKRAFLNFGLSGYDRNLKLYILSQAIFTLGNSSNQFLLLRTTDLTGDLSLTILMYIVFNLASTLLSTAFGSLSDKVGRKKLLLAGYALYAVVYGAFGFITKEWWFLLWGFWPLYGLYYAVTEGVEKAYVSDLAPVERRATALGLLATVEGVLLLPASAIAGFLYLAFPGAPYLFGAAMSLTAFLVLALAVKGKAKEGNASAAGAAT